MKYANRPNLNDREQAIYDAVDPIVGRSMAFSILGIWQVALASNRWFAYGEPARVFVKKSPNGRGIVEVAATYKVCVVNGDRCSNTTARVRLKFKSGSRPLSYRVSAKLREVA